MATALASLLTNRPVRPKLGMTGEITLRGKVLPIGGVKEKVLAAARYGLDTVILPRRNESDLEELPEAVRKQMKFIFVDTVEQVLVAALLSPEEMQKSANGQAYAPLEKLAQPPRRRKPSVAMTPRPL
jgi:ATP-dependent Lon protease